MHIGYGILQCEDLGCTDLFFAFYACLCADFGNAVVYCLDLDHLCVFVHYGGVRLVIWQEPFRRFQLLYKPFSIGNILENEYTVLAGLGCENCIFLCKLCFICFEQTEQSALNGFFCFTVDF